jgi:hypothetical protein
MSKNSSLALYKQLKEWQMVFNRNRRYKPKKKKVMTPTTQYYVDQNGKVVFVDDEE